MKILVIKLSSIGDIFHALPAVHSLKENLGANIDWVVHREYMDVIKCFPDVQRVIPFFRDSFFSNFALFLRELRREEYDYIIDLQGLLKSAMVAYLARGKEIIGPSFHREGAGIIYSRIAGQRNKHRHAVDECMDVAELLCDKSTVPLKVEFPVQFPESKITGGHPKVAMLPVSRWETKNWPAKCYVEVIRRLKTLKEIEFFLIGGPDDRAVCEGIIRDAGAGVNMAGKLSLIETGSLLKEMDLLIANDSGPMHMAVALDVPVLAIYGPTDPVRTGPYGSLNRIAKTSLDCQPCFSRTCRRDGIPCLSGVTPENVIEMALEMLKK
ncbi:MAG: hypothetical protein A2283_08115 [Lentisphaerae bacterium RIFOXYA12_FULL_48_11]|nr:MAG: hypothetical protein A2283_08115 [Lentisphaerae bacterium RIFOXYA12_FULL_48_11]